MDFDFILRGTQPLLMHADDVLQSDELTSWRQDPTNRNVSVAGDDRHPAWTWQTYLYHDGTHLAVPQECVMTALRTAGAKVPAKGKSTFKALSQSGMIVTSDYCEFRCGGKQIPILDLIAVRDAPFGEHVKRAQKLGFDLSIKRAKIGTSKHVRVRPIFHDWTVSGQIAVSEPAITEDVLRNLMAIAGRLAGLGDWRPSAPKSPGPHGMFTAEVVPVGSRKRVA